MTEIQACVPCTAAACWPPHNNQHLQPRIPTQSPRPVLSSARWDQYVHTSHRSHPCSFRRCSEMLQLKHGPWWTTHHFLPVRPASFLLRCLGTLSAPPQRVLLCVCRFSHLKSAHQLALPQQDVGQAWSPHRRAGGAGGTAAAAAEHPAPGRLRGIDGKYLDAAATFRCSCRALALHMIAGTTLHPQGLRRFISIINWCMHAVRRVILQGSTTFTSRCACGSLDTGPSVATGATVRYHCQLASATGMNAIHACTLQSRNTRVQHCRAVRQRCITARPRLSSPVEGAITMLQALTSSGEASGRRKPES